MPNSTDPIPSPPWWLNAYSTVQPIGWALREAFPDRWVRIHSLTNSKRYADSTAEWDELRSRHRHATSLMFRPQEDGFLITSWPDHGVFRELGLAPTHALPEVQPDEDEPPTGPYHAARFLWDFDAFCPILEAVADDAARAIFVTADATRIYAPYDGGADLFFMDPPQLASSSRSGQPLFVRPARWPMPQRITEGERGKEFSQN